MGDSTYDIAFHFGVNHIPAATIPASRLSTILEQMHRGHPLTTHSLSYLQSKLPELYRLAAAQITYEAYMAALDPALMARLRGEWEENKAKETQLRAVAAEYAQRRTRRPARGAAPALDREAQHKLRRQREREETEAVLRAQRAYQATMASQRERNREAAAAAFQVRASAPDHVGPTPIDIARHFHAEHLSEMLRPPLSTILDALFRGNALSREQLDHLKREAPPDLYRLAFGQLDFDTYRASIEAAKAEAIAKKARADALEAARVARESDPAYIAQMRRQGLCRKYGLFAPAYAAALPTRLMEILERIDSGTRLPEEDFAWLTTTGKTHFTQQLREAYHHLEANFLATEYRRSGDPWKAVNASGQYRKCSRPDDAIALLDSLQPGRIKHPKLKSAICTTRGGAMRDLDRRSEALSLGEEAHRLQPQNYRPCTLLGAVHMELGNFDHARQWYLKAEQRGATAQSIDTELRSIFQRADKARREAMKVFLLAEDPQRYSWVNDKKHQGTMRARNVSSGGPAAA